MEYQNNAPFSAKQDSEDPLKRFRSAYHIPVINGKEVIYLCGNSLGLQPKITKDYIQYELDNWANLAVEGHFKGPQPWMKYHELFNSSLTKLLGAKEIEVTCMNNLTTNLHLLLASFYQPKGSRRKVIIEGGAFPSDHYAVASHMRHLGVNPGEHMIELRPKDGVVFSTTEIAECIAEAGEELALILFPGIQYYSGQFFDMKAISAAAHDVGAYAGFDLAHAVGNLPLTLHDDEVDFATWCSYKYLNSGPGGVSGIYIHEKHCTQPDFHKLTGWWGHHPDTRFKMDNQFKPAPGSDAWMLSNTNIISSAAHLAALKLFDETSMKDLRTKSIKLTGFLEYLLLNDSTLSDQLTIITPSDANARGCQLSILIQNNGKAIFDGLIERGVILDWREPNVIRVAPTPMYNSFLDVFNFYNILKDLITHQHA